MMVANMFTCGANVGTIFIGHEELAETEDATRVECAAKRLVDVVKVSGLALSSRCICTVAYFMRDSCRVQ